MTLRKPAACSFCTHKAASALGILLSIILIPILIINLTLMFRSHNDPEHVPDIGGFVPMAIMTNSMEPAIVSGDLVIFHTADAGELSVGDIIAFYDPESTGNAVVTHRVASIGNAEDGSLTFTTKGDANNSADTAPLPAANVIGIYRTRIPGLGNLVLFMQTPKGIFLFVVLPLLLLMGWDSLRRTLEERKKAKADENKETAAAECSQSG